MSAGTIATDYLAAEQLLVAQLEAAQIPGVKKVLTAEDIAGVQERQQTTPAIHVIYVGDSVPQDQGSRGQQGKPQRVIQRWRLVVAVRSARGTRSGEGAREQAGPIMSGVIDAVQGWAPAADLPRGFRRTNGVAAGYSAGFGYFPLDFLLEIDT